MNKKYFYLVLGLSVIGLWGGRLLWRAHKDIVSLHVRNAPLAEVIRSIEWQTWERIVADAQLNTQITLNVEDMPLREVLERIAEQAGAILTTIHAVHESRVALQPLELALQAGEVTKAKGWTNIAPSLDAPADTLGGLLPGGLPESAGMANHFTTEAPRELSVGADKPRSMPFPGGPGPMMMRGASPGGPVEVIIPERIVLEAKLQGRLNTNAIALPDLVTALAVAEQVDGRCTTLYALKKSAIGFAPGGLRHRMGPPLAGATNTPGPLPLANAAQEAKRAELGRYMNLTPEQRVEQARNRRPRLIQPPEGEPPQ